MRQIQLAADGWPGHTTDNLLGSDSHSASGNDMPTESRFR